VQLTIATPIGLNLFVYKSAIKIAHLMCNDDDDEQQKRGNKVLGDAIATLDKTKANVPLMILYLFKAQLLMRSGEHKAVESTLKTCDKLLEDIEKEFPVAEDDRDSKNRDTALESQRVSKERRGGGGVVLCEIDCDGRIAFTHCCS